MSFGDLVVGDHFIWPPESGSPAWETVNVNIKIASSEDGGGFAIDLATRCDCLNPAGQISGEPPGWIPATARVIKLNGRL
jgi:hypothetical protein